MSAGEAILQIANPAKVRFSIDLPVRESLVLKDGARIKVFLDSDPLRPVEATLVEAAIRQCVTSETYCPIGFRGNWLIQTANYLALACRAQLKFTETRRHWFMFCCENRLRACGSLPDGKRYAVK